MNTKEKIVAWCSINVFWWVLSIWLGFGRFKMDVNPIFNNFEEIMFNVIIFCVGFVIINVYNDKKK